ncbi:MAG: nucleotidyltransferase domain-containing protein [Rhodobacter sp.]|nr:nucleotidyltransferase domain-containing protein [Rhodobacter sp.]MCY4168082.1 nucleotidyltransferase domain-containing protein [Rhodobacter sp.]MCY4242170.1 nucleotidyltransferase domain-containing protein [Rhodobacter sp.]
MDSDDRSRILSGCEAESTRQLNLMRDIAQEMFAGDRNHLIGVNGSVARRECTRGSDVDLFFLFDGKETDDETREAQQAYRRRLEVGAWRRTVYQCPPPEACSRNLWESTGL